jgi:hypothetical protein
MKLSYRGIGYDYAPSDLDMLAGESGGQYRGQNYKFYYPRHIPVAVPIVGLTYRGLSIGAHSAQSVDREISESFGTDVAPQQTTAQPVTTKQPAQVNVTPLRAHRRQLLQQVADTHRSNIRQRLEHRLHVARERGDQVLVQMLEAEYQQLA